MEIQVQLFVQEHHNRHFSLEVVGEPSLRVYCTDLEKGREDLYLVLNDRIERLHPGLQSRYASPQNQTHELVEVAEALKIEGPLGINNQSTEVSVIVTLDRKWKRLWFPRWDCHYWIPADTELQTAVETFIQRHLLKKMNLHTRLEHRLERKEWLETLIVEATPPPLESFTGKHLNKEMLPPPVEEKDKDENDDDDEPLDGEEKKPKPKKKKRPPTPTLQMIGVPIHQLAKEKELEHAYGREKELEDLMRFIQTPGGSSIVLIGKSGVGKSTILNELAYRLRDKKKQPESIHTRPIWFVDASRLVAGDGGFGDWQRQCLDVVQESIDAEVIWYIGSLLPLLDAGKNISSDQNISFLLRPYLAGKRLTLIGECTPRTWSQLELRDIGFARLFTPYRIEEPSERELRRILRFVCQDIHKEHEITVHKDAQNAVIELSRRYNNENSLQGNAIHFLRRIAEEATIEEKDNISRTEVVSQFCSETGLPEFLIRDDLPLDPESIWMTFQQRLIGQDEAVRRMTDLVAMIKSGLSDLHRPLGSFLFVGPTGVGKTEMAKTLTKYLFGREDRLIRFDMSEFVHPNSVHRFLGDGQQEGKLVSEIRRTPFAVLLLDEIEKAHPAVFDVLLQVLGEALLSDESGRTADFRNAVILMTSNLGVGTLRRQLGFGEETTVQFREHFIAEAERFFRPEFFNRIDYIIPFFPLEQEAIEQITHREMDKFMRREGIRQGNLELQTDNDLHDWLANKGVDPRYGARPLKRVIEQQLSAPLSKHLSTLNPDQHHTIQIVPQQHQLEFLNLASTTKRKDKHQTRGQLQLLLRELNQLRFQTHRWLKTPQYRELTHEIKLFDRLSQDPNFWVDKRMAEDRMNEIKQGRELVQEFHAFQEQVASLEDLAFELYYDRNTSPLPMLKQDLAQAQEKLSQLELNLVAKRFSHPNRAVLYFAEDKDSASTARTWIKIYASLAEKNGWTISGYVARRLEEHQLKAQGIHTDNLISEQDYKKQQAEIRKERQLQRASHGDNNDKLTPTKTKKTRKEKKIDTPLERLRWAWRYVSTYNPQEENPNLMLTRFLDEMYAYGEETHPKALVIEGPFAACLLHGESGVHQWIEQSVAQIRVRVEDQKIPTFEKHAHSLDTKQALNFPELQRTDLLHPVDLDEQWPTHRRRVIHHGKKIVRDMHLQIHFVLEPRIYLIYQRFMRANMYFSIFGDKALKWFQHEE